MNSGNMIVYKINNANSSMGIFMNEKQQQENKN